LITLEDLQVIPFTKEIIYVGLIILFVVPAYLLYKGRKLLKNESAPKNEIHTSIFRHPFWIYLIGFCALGTCAMTIWGLVLKKGQN
jgi:hypothetical protein